MANGDGFVPIQTKASKALQDQAKESFKVTVFEPKKAAQQKKRTARVPPPTKSDNEKHNSEDDEEEDIDDIFSDAPRKRRKQKEDPTVFDMDKARRDVMNLGFSGFDKESKQAASVRLAIKLGAKPPKNPYRNYREMLEEQKAAKLVDGDVAAKRRKGQMAFGATASYNQHQQRKQDKQRNPKSIMEHYGKANPRIGKK